MIEIEQYVRSQLGYMMKGERSLVLPEPDEEGDSLTYEQGRTYGWDQAWYIGRKELLGDILRKIEMGKILDEVRKDEE